MLGFPRMKWLRRDLLFAAALFLASSGTVQQYLGLAGVAAYAVGLAVVVPIALQVALPWFERHVSERQALVLAGVTLLVLVVVFAVVYPHANVHTQGHGSDRDDAANIGTRRLFHLEYPYAQPTYLGNMISQLPGAFILDAPFVAMGSSAYQNVFWIGVLFLLLRWWARDSRLALAAMWLVLALSPALLREYLNGGDVIANTVAMVVFMVGVLHLPTRWAPAVAAGGLGLALAWRPNLWYWLPLFAVVLVRARGWRAALAYAAVAAGVCAAVMLPFYLPHRHDFAPLLTARKVRRYDDVVSKSSVIVLGATALVTLGLCRRLLRGDVPLLAACALVQAFLLGFVVLLASVSAGRPDFSPLVLAYGLFFLVPATFWLVRSSSSKSR
jgi:hypothetical protein